MPRLLFILLFVAVYNIAEAQQVEQFTMIRENAMALNPAYAGAKGYMDGTVSFRKQYSRITDAPYTAMASWSMQFQEKNFGLGGTFLHDQTGPTGLSGFTIAASYQLRLNSHEFLNLDHEWFNNENTHMITFGLSFSVAQYRLNGDKLKPEMANDPQLASAPAWQVFPDASVGIHYQYGNKFFIDFSCPQLLGLNIKYKGADKLTAIKRVQHINFMVGGNIKLDNNEKPNYLQPIGSLRWARFAPPQADLGLRFFARNLVWIGCNYRTVNAVIFEAGVNIKDYVKIGYSYDLEITKYRADIGSTHEVMVSFLLKNKLHQSTW